MILHMLLMSAALHTAVPVPVTSVIYQPGPLGAGLPDPALGLGDMGPALAASSVLNQRVNPYGSISLNRASLNPNVNLYGAGVNRYGIGQNSYVGLNSLGSGLISHSARPNSYGAGLNSYGLGLNPYGSGLNSYGSGLNPYGSGLNPYGGGVGFATSQYG